MNRLALVSLLSLLLAVSCSGKTPQSGACTANDDCSAGQVCFSGECSLLCSSDRDCGPNDCAGGSICTNDVCVPGCRANVPTINSIDGDGSPDADSSHAAHHIGNSLVIDGENLEGVSVELIGSDTQTLNVTSSSATQIVAELPTNVTADSYTVRVFNAVGEDQGPVTLLQGEVGPQGPAGPAGPLPTVTVGGGITGDGSGGAPLALDTSFLDSRDLAPPSLVLPNATTTERDAIASPSAGQVVFNTTTGDLNFYDGSAWRSASSGFRIHRATTALETGVNLNGPTPLWDHAIAGLPANTKAVIVGVYYLHGSSTASTHGYLDFWVYQRGHYADTENAVRYVSRKYNDYYNSDYIELIVPWDKSLNDDTLRFEVTHTYNSNGANVYDISYRGHITAN